jgi:mxaA protein
MKRASAGVALAAVLAAAQGQGVRVETDEPRAFGYRIGDTVQRHVTVHADAGWLLDETTLPRPGARGGALELRRVAVHTHDDGAGRRLELDLLYQVFVAPPAVRTFEMPSFRVRFNGPQRAEDVRVEAWPVTVAPLSAPEASARRGLGELRPDRSPPWIDVRALRMRLLAWALAALLLLGTLAVIQFGPPWRAARNRPFGSAWRQLRHLPADAPGARWRAACQQMHAALNRCAGEVVFENGLARFVAARPAFAPLRDDLARFLRLSRAEFFGAPARERGDAAWLVDLCRRCRDAEQGFGVPGAKGSDAV